MCERFWTLPQCRPALDVPSFQRASAAPRRSAAYAFAADLLERLCCRRFGRYCPDKGRLYNCADGQPHRVQGPLRRMQRGLKTGLSFSRGNAFFRLCEIDIVEDAFLPGSFEGIRQWCFHDTSVSVSGTSPRPHWMKDALRATPAGESAERNLSTYPSQSFIHEARLDRSVIRIQSAHNWPERTVFNTNLPTIIPPSSQIPNNHLYEGLRTITW
jgi:hypothetical protein